MRSILDKTHNMLYNLCTGVNMRQVTFFAPPELTKDFDQQAKRLSISRSALLRLLMGQVVSNKDLRMSVANSPELEPITVAELEY